MNQSAATSLCVVMATYNGSKFIKACLHSICRQLEPTDFIVLVDDCSSDSTLDIASEILSGYNVGYSIRCNRRNQGPSRSFEIAFENVPQSASYVVVSDQDDIWLNNRASIVRHNAKYYKSIVLNSYLLVGRRTKQRIQGDAFSVCTPSYSFVRNLIRPSFIGCHLAFHPSLLELMLPFPPSVYMYDMLLGICIMLNQESSIVIKTPSMLYRRHENVFTPTKTSLLFKVRVRFRYAMTIAWMYIRRRRSQHA